MKKIKKQSLMPLIISAFLVSSNVILKQLSFVNDLFYGLIYGGAFGLLVISIMIQVKSNKKGVV
jgi:hypothetical protein